jgi:hypothetical protein
MSNQFDSVSAEYTMSRFASSGDLRAAMLKEIAHLRATNEWQPIETAPTTFPPERCLLTGNGLGTHIGTVSRYEDGSVLASVGHIAGNVADMVTHWMPLPLPPSFRNGSASQ